MARKHHDWKIDKPPPPIRPHSLAKHRVLRQYLERYVSVLTRNVRQEQFRLTLVDGFSGGGRYVDDHSGEERPGSPLIMLEAMRDAANEAQQRRSKPFHLDVHYFFVEKDRGALDYLRRTISETEYRRLIDDRIHFNHGDFVAHSPDIVRFIKSRGGAERAIFFLDQFGYSAVPLSTIREILAVLRNAEVILTFATDWLIDYLSANEQTQRIIERLGITLPSKTIQTIKQQRDWRRAIQFLLHRQIPENTGAEFYTPFFIRSADADRDFWLIHLSGHFRARDVMVGLHWEQSTFAHYGRSGLRMLGYDQDRDAAWTDQPMLPGFFFDETAHASSQQELLDELPETLSTFKDGVALTDLFSAVANDCPVTLAIMEGVLNDLAREGVIDIRDKSGSKTRRGAIQHHSDIIIPSRQKRIYFP